MSKAVIYCRVSSTEQVDGTSLATQEAICREYCAKHKLSVDRVFVDRGESAKTADRPQFLDMIRFVQKAKEIARVVIYKTDRFARSSLDYAVYRHKLRECGTVLVSATEPVSDDPTGKMLETMLAGFAEFDNEIRAQRAKTAMAEIKRRGGWTHKAPFGFHIVRHDGLPVLEPNPQTTPVVEKCLDLVAAGNRPQDVFIKVKPKMGRAQFFSMFRNSLYANFKGWHEAQVAMGAVQLYRKRGEEFPLKGLLLCADCNGPLTGSVVKGNGGKYHYYHCHINGHAGRSSAKQINEQVAKLLSEISVVTPAIMSLLRDYLHQAAHEDQAVALTDKGQLTTEIESLTKRKERLLDALTDGAIDTATYRRKVEGFDIEITKCQYLLEQCDREIILDDAMIEQTGWRLKDLPTLWNSWDSETRARLIKIFFPNGIIVSRGTFQTTAIDSIFKELLQQNRVNSGMAPPTGFEPVLLG